MALTSMGGSFRPLLIRRALDRMVYRAPEPFGPDGWCFRRFDEDGEVIVSCADHDGVDWIHASIAHPDRLPDYDELVLVHRAVFGAGYAYQVFAPPADHVNLHAYALHLFGRWDGLAALPNFTRGTGSI
jgi:hypothetical protein